MGSAMLSSCESLPEICTCIFYTGACFPYFLSEVKVWISLSYSIVLLGREMGLVFSILMKGLLNGYWQLTYSVRPLAWPWRGFEANICIHKHSFQSKNIPKLYGIRKGYPFRPTRKAYCLTGAQEPSWRALSFIQRQKSYKICCIVGSRAF